MPANPCRTLAVNCILVNSWSFRAFGEVQPNTSLSCISCSSFSTILQTLIGSASEGINPINFWIGELGVMPGVGSAPPCILVFPPHWSYPLWFNHIVSHGAKDPGHYYSSYNCNENRSPFVMPANHYIRGGNKSHWRTHRSQPHQLVDHHHHVSLCFCLPSDQSNLNYHNSQGCEKCQSIEDEEDFKRSTLHYHPCPIGVISTRHSENGGKGNCGK